jgi:N utilization substance protein A
VREVLVDDEDKQATVIVPDDQLSLAIGRDGQNARLAARLTGWRVDIKSETEFASEEQEVEIEGEETFDGRCMAVLSNGRRCPNAAVGGSTYCGLPQHQALSRFDTSQVAVLTPLTDDEVTILADPEGDEARIDEIVARADAQFEESAAEEAPAEDLDAGSTEPVPAEDVEDAAEEMAAPDPEQPAEAVPAEPEADEAQAAADAESEAALPETEDPGGAPEAEPAEAEAEAAVGEAEQN